MGNSYVNDKNLQILIETEKPYYNSGSSIEGTIIVEAHKNFQFDALYLRIEGNEQCLWFQGSSKNRRKYLGSQNFYTVEHVIHKYQQAFLQQGKYAHPFSLQLSDNIPGSFESQQHPAKIQYKLIAYFVNYKNPKKTQLIQKPILIREPFRQDMVSYTGENIGEPKKFGLFSKGLVKLQVSFNRNVAFQGQQIGIIIHANNRNGNTDLSKFKIQLVQYTFISSNGNATRTYRSVINRKSVDMKVIRGDSKQTEIVYDIPRVKYQTAISTLVANYYRIQVSTNLGFGVTQNPSIYAPIFILKRNLDSKEKVSKKTYDIQSGYIVAKAVCMRAGEYIFRKNRNLQVVNFKSDDLMTQDYGSEQNNYQ